MNMWKQPILLFLSFNLSTFFSGPTLDKLNEIEQDRFFETVRMHFLSDAFSLLSFCYRGIVTVT